MEKGVNISYTPRGIIPRDPDVADEDFPHAYFEEGHVQHHPEPAPVAVGTDPPRPTEGSVVFQEGHHLSARYSTNSGQRESSSALFSDSGFHWPSVEKLLLCYLGQLEEIKMYGMVNQAVRGLVLEQFGKEAWTKIHEKAESPENFDAFKQYDDTVTYGLVGAATEVLELPAEKILYAFGEYWVLKVAAQSYADLMDKTGTDFLAFVKGLDHMHSRIKGTFPNYTPPSFRVEVLAEDRFQLDYYSDREGLLPFVEGLMHGLAIHFEQEIQIRQIPDDQHSMPCKRMEVSYRSGANG